MNIDELARQAQHFLDTEQYEKAARAYEQILEIDPNHRIALVNLGIIHVDHLPDQAKARTLLERAIELYPDEGNAYYSLGVCEGGEGNYGRAITLYARAIRLKWRPGRAHHNAGKSYWELADIAWKEGERDQAKHLLLKAMRQFLRAAKIIPDFPLALRALGSCYYNLGFYDKAIKYYNLTLQIVPTDIIAWRGKFRIYAKQGNYEKVQEAVDEVRRWSGGFHSVETILKGCEAYLKDLTSGEREGVGAEDIAELRKSIVGSMENLGTIIHQGFQSTLKGDQVTASSREPGSGVWIAPPWVPSTRPLARKERERLLDIKGKLDRNGDVIGESVVMLRVFERIHWLNQLDVDCPIVLLGDTGVGKTFLVPCIVSSSRRAEKRCETINAQLFASGDFTVPKGEVLGYAPDHGFRDIPRQGKPGLLQHCEGGTMFIDEVFDLPREMQTLLLSIIDSQPVQRVGDKTRGFKPNVRLVLATNRDPSVEVANGTLRLDLWSRIGSFTITVPPLRDRKEDIPLIARHFLGEKKIPAEILLALLLHDWRHGNVRELIHSISKLPKTTIQKADLAYLELPDLITSKVEAMETDEAELQVTRILADQLKNRGFERSKGLNMELARIMRISESKVSALLKRADA